MKYTLLLTFALALTAEPARAQRALDPSDATVLIRVIGNVHLELNDVGNTRTIDRRDVRVGAGSGFVVSPYGYVMTAHHVVATQQVNEQRAGVAVRLTVEPTRFEVVLPRMSGTGGTLPPPAPLSASLVASDPAADLAVLFVSSTLPYLALGDSDAVERGQPVQALGYPFGDIIGELLGNTASDRAPDLSASAGTATALRRDSSGGLQFIQTDATINPGNSGGPLLDDEGYVVGIVVSQVREGSRNTGIGFAVPINRAKDMIEARGLDQLLPTRRLRVGPLEHLVLKGMSVPLVEGRTDVDPSRLHVDIGDTDTEVLFRADRIYTPWTLQEVERWLLTERALEPDLITQRPRASVVDRSRRLRGRAIARERTSGRAVELAYEIVDLGSEKVIARFAGTPEQMAFNRSVLDAALAAVEAEALLDTSAPRLSAIAWIAGTLQADQAPAVLVPAEWPSHLGSGAVCTNLHPAARALWVSPPGDFTLSLRLAWWPKGTVDANEVASACGGGLTDQAPSVQRTTWAGVSYVTEGVVRTVEGGVVQLAVIAPNTRVAAARAVFAEWVRRALR